MIHVSIGAEARYIKTAPVLWAMEHQGIDHRLGDSGRMRNRGAA